MDRDLVRGMMGRNPDAVSGEIQQEDRSEAAPRSGFIFVTALNPPDSQKSLDQSAFLFLGS